jgi:acyl carrier protein
MILRFCGASELTCGDIGTAAKLPRRPNHRHRRASPKHRLGEREAMSDTEQKMRVIVAELGGISEDFDGKAHFFRDLGLESTKALELLFQIEDAFEIAMPDDEYNQVQHLEQLVALIDKLKAEG